MLRAGELIENMAHPARLKATYALTYSRKTGSCNQKAVATPPLARPLLRLRVGFTSCGGDFCSLAGGAPGAAFRVLGSAFDSGGVASPNFLSFD
jgi:hypothetical protein